MTASIQIVRRYGPVGGMERYVWELSHALAKRGKPVRILCEKAHQFPAPETGIEVIELGEAPPKPRWLSMLRFSSNVSRWCRENDCQHWVIHSHERTAVHDVTTFHGPPFAERKKRLLDFLSPRIHTWLSLEKRELCGQQTQAVLPNSDLIALSLSKHYPCCVPNLGKPAYPGVNDHFYSIQRNSNAYTIGFIGKEWKRKGLPFACKIVRKLRETHPEVSFVVAGPAPNEIEHLFSDWPEQSFRLLGWAKTEDVVTQSELILHPAKAEPFGMVIAEANAAGARCLISDLCGIANMITPEMGNVLSLESNIDQWCAAATSLLGKKGEIPKLQLRWQGLAEQHSALYQSIFSRKQGLL